MPATEYQGSSSPFASIGRSILSIRRDQVHSVDGNHGGGYVSSHEQELDGLQRHVADLLADLAAAPPAELLSLSWIRKLLDTFLICMEEFRVVLFNNRSAIKHAPMDRFITDFYERAVKGLDVCNAVRDGIDQVRQWRRHLDIVVAALGPANHSPLGEGQLRRAKKALADLAISMLDDKTDNSSTSVAHRNRSFGRNRDNHSSGSAAKQNHFRSLSWSVSRSWSAARQLNSIAANLSAPRGNEIAATTGLVVPVYTMNIVLLFTMWALVAAIPCQDRGLQVHFSIPRNFPWAASIASLHEKILEESKKRDRRNTAGLLKEIHQIEKISRHLTELADSVHYPIEEDKEVEIRDAVREISEVCDSMKEEIDPLERQVREVFHRIVRSRTEGLDCSSYNAG